MIWPILIVVGIGRYAWIPVPLILLWPLLAALWLMGVVRNLVRPGAGTHAVCGALGAVPGICAAANGTRIKVNPAHGPVIRVIVV